MDACPTGAIVQERVVDARRCISYLTIEKRGELTAEEAESLGDQVFGCDICQEVCPYNRINTVTSEPDFEPVAGRLAPRLVDLLAMDASEFAERFQGSPVKRTKLQGLQRNARAVLANQARRVEQDQPSEMS